MPITVTPGAKTLEERKIEALERIANNLETIAGELINYDDFGGPLHHVAILFDSVVGTQRPQFNGDTETDYIRTGNINDD